MRSVVHALGLGVCQLFSSIGARRLFILSQDLLEGNDHKGQYLEGFFTTSCKP